MKLRRKRHIEYVAPLLVAGCILIGASLSGWELTVAGLELGSFSMVLLGAIITLVGLVVGVRSLRPAPPG